MKPTVLILPGYGNSGPQHWQTRWEVADPACVRVEQRNWERPVCSEWVAKLECAVDRHGPQTLMVAHSLACLQLAHWASVSTLRIAGAMLVAPPDPDGPNFPEEAIGFDPVPMKPFSFPSIVVASIDDPYAGVEFADRCATAWGSRFINIGPAGHINADSGLEDWPQGREIFSMLTAPVRRQAGAMN